MNSRKAIKVTIFTILIICIVVVSVLAKNGIIYFGFNAENSQETNNIEFDINKDSNATVGGLVVKDPETVIEELNKKVEDSMINISMNMKPTFKTGKSKGNLLIVNSNVNKYTQVIEIYRIDNNELIYKSGGIPVGSKIEEAKLDVELSKGTYDCIAYFNAVNEETKQMVGKAGAQIQIEILN